MVIPTQHDRGYETNGLVDLLMRLEHQTSTDIQVLHFTEDYVERHHAIKKILRMYNTNSVPRLKGYKSYMINNNS